MSEWVVGEGSESIFVVSPRYVGDVAVELGA